MSINASVLVPIWVDVGASAQSSSDHSIRLMMAIRCHIYKYGWQFLILYKFREHCLNGTFTFPHSHILTPKWNGASISLINSETENNKSNSPDAIKVMTETKDASANAFPQPFPFPRVVVLFRMLCPVMRDDIVMAGQNGAEAKPAAE